MTYSTSSQVSSSTSQQLVNTVYTYSLSVVDSLGDVQHLKAAFSSIPTSQDWLNWLNGWTRTGYSLHTQPQLINAV